VGIFTEGWNWTLRCLEKPLQKRIATYRFVNSVLIIRRKWCAECSNVFPEPAKFALSIRTQARPGSVVYQDKNTVSQKMCHAAKGFQRMGFLP
jgi:hypothetical protein